MGTGRILDHTPAFHEAMGLAREGETVKAEGLLLAALDERVQRWGHAHAETAYLHHELGLLRMAMGDGAGAVEAFHAAVAFEDWDDVQATRDRLTYLMNLGVALQGEGRLVEAETVLRDGLACREQFYGVDHAGYGFGLEPLADVLLAQGKLEAANEASMRLVRNFSDAGHPRVLDALAMRAEVLHQMHVAPRFFDGFMDLAERDFEALVDAVINRMRAAPPAMARRVLSDVWSACEQRGEPCAAVCGHVLSALAQHAYRGQDWEGYRGFLVQLIPVLEHNGGWRSLVGAYQGLAIALDELDCVEDALDAYRAGLTWAERLESPVLMSQVARDAGLFLAERTQRDDARRWLMDALSWARESGDEDTQGRALIALGILLQHGGELEPAVSLLEEGVTYLPAGDRDALCGHNHLDAIVNHRSCGCGNMDAAISAALQSLVIAQVPAGLVAAIEYRSSAEASGEEVLHVELQREPTEAERALLGRALQHARRQLAQSGGR